jgi:hypothetical protein
MYLPLFLQRLYDSEINVTIVTLWDGGFDFAWFRIWSGKRPLGRSIT